MSTVRLRYYYPVSAMKMSREVHRGTHPIVSTDVAAIAACCLSAYMFSREPIPSNVPDGSVSSRLEDSLLRGCVGGETRPVMGYARMYVIVDLGRA